MAFVSVVRDAYVYYEDETDRRMTGSINTINSVQSKISKGADHDLCRNASHFLPSRYRLLHRQPVSQNVGAMQGLFVQNTPAA